MAMLKNIRHEHFVREYIRNGGQARAAYLYVTQMFPGKPLRHPKSASVVACILLKRPDVRRREQEIRDLMVKKSDITIEKILTDYEFAKNLAKSQAKPNEIVNAATAQAKLVGLLRDRVETGDVGDFDGIEDISAILEKAEAEAGPEVALAVAKALGLAPAETTEAEKEKGDDGLIDQSPPSDSVN